MEMVGTFDVFHVGHLRLLQRASTPSVSTTGVIEVIRGSVTD